MFLKKCALNETYFLWPLELIKYRRQFSLYYILLLNIIFTCLGISYDWTLFLFIICSVTCFISIIFHIVIIRRSQYKRGRCKIAFPLFAFTLLSGKSLLKWYKISQLFLLLPKFSTIYIYIQEIWENILKYSTTTKNHS